MRNLLEKKKRTEMGQTFGLDSDCDMLLRALGIPLTHCAHFTVINMEVRRRRRNLPEAPSRSSPPGRPWVPQAHLLPQQASSAQSFPSCVTSSVRNKQGILFYGDTQACRGELWDLNPLCNCASLDNPSGWTAACKPRREASEETTPANSLILDFQPPML